MLGQQGKRRAGPETLCSHGVVENARNVRPTHALCPMFLPDASIVLPPDIPDADAVIDAWCATEEAALGVASPPCHHDDHAHSTGVSPHKRRVVLDWLASVVAKYRMGRETYFLAAAAMDRVVLLAAAPPSSSPSSSVWEQTSGGTPTSGAPSLLPDEAELDLPLLAAACFWAAAKFEEGCAPRATQLCALLPGAIQPAALCAMELRVLSALGYGMRGESPSAFRFLGAYVKACGVVDARVPLLAAHMLELATLTGDGEGKDGSGGGAEGGRAESGAAVAVAAMDADAQPDTPAGRAPAQRQWEQQGQQQQHSCQRAALPAPPAPPTAPCSHTPCTTSSHDRITASLTLHPIRSAFAAATAGNPASCGPALPPAANSLPPARRDRDPPPSASAPATTTCGPSASSAPATSGNDVTSEFCTVVRAPSLTHPSTPSLLVARAAPPAPASSSPVFASAAASSVCSLLSCNEQLATSPHSTRPEAGAAGALGEAGRRARALAATRSLRLAAFPGYARLRSVRPSNLAASSLLAACACATLSGAHVDALATRLAAKCGAPAAQLLDAARALHALHAAMDGVLFPAAMVEVYREQAAWVARCCPEGRME